MKKISFLQFLSSPYQKKVKNSFSDNFEASGLPHGSFEALCRGGIFSQSSVFQAFSDVMVIIDEVSTFCRGQFANLGPHLAILLLTHPIE